MVLLHVKRGDDDEFLVECSCGDPGQDVLAMIVSLHNRRRVLAFLADNVDALAEYGPMRPEEERGLEGTADPTGVRCGVPPQPGYVQTLQRVAKDAHALVDKKQAEKRVVLKPEHLEECEMNIRGAVAIAYPMGLPECDVLRQWVDDRLDLSGTLVSKNIMELDESALWFAGKRISTGDPLGKAIGSNEKTKVVVRLQRLSSGAPVREPAVDKETQKAMMAYYHKKQEEQKRLEEDNQDSYLNSDWANPKQYKQHFQGLSPGNIKWRP
ncbi:Ubiquitin-like domain-containing protein [Plasmodiophora brassicae]